MDSHIGKSGKQGHKQPQSWMDWLQGKQPETEPKKGTATKKDPKAKLNAELRESFRTEGEKLASRFFEIGHPEASEKEKASKAAAIVKFVTILKGYSFEGMKDVDKQGVANYLPLYLKQTQELGEYNEITMQYWNHLIDNTSFITMLESLHENGRQNILKDFLLALPASHLLNLRIKLDKKDDNFSIFFKELLGKNLQPEKIVWTNNTRNVLYSIQSSKNEDIASTAEVLLKHMDHFESGTLSSEEFNAKISKYLENNKEEMKFIINTLHSKGVLINFLAGLSEEAIIRIVALSLFKYTHSAMLVLGKTGIDNLPTEFKNNLPIEFRKDFITQAYTDHCNDLKNIIRSTFDIKGLELPQALSDLYGFLSEHPIPSSDAVIEVWEELCKNEDIQKALKRAYENRRLKKLIVSEQYTASLLSFIPKLKAEIIASYKKSNIDPIFTLSKLSFDSCVEFCLVLQGLKLSDEQLTQAVEILLSKAEEPYQLEILCNDGQFHKLLEKAYKVKNTECKKAITAFLVNTPIEKLLTLRQFTSVVDEAISKSEVIGHEELLEKILIDSSEQHIGIAKELIKYILKQNEISFRKKLLINLITFFSTEPSLSKWKEVCEDAEFVELLEHPNYRDIFDISSIRQARMLVEIAQHSKIFNKIASDQFKTQDTLESFAEAGEYTTEDLLNIAALNPTLEHAILGDPEKKSSWNKFKSIVGAIGSIVKVFFRYDSGSEIEVNGALEARLERAMQKDNYLETVKILFAAKDGYLKRQISLASVERLFKLVIQHHGINKFYKEFGKDILEILIDQRQWTSEILKKNGYVDDNNKSFDELQWVIKGEILKQLESPSFKKIVSTEVWNGLIKTFKSDSIDVVPPAFKFISASFENLNPTQVLSYVKSYLIELSQDSAGRIKGYHQLSKVDLENLKVLKKYLEENKPDDAKYKGNNWDDLKGLISDLIHDKKFDDKKIENIHNKKNYGHLPSVNLDRKKDDEAKEYAKKAFMRPSNLKFIKSYIEKGLISPHAFGVILKDLLKIATHVNKDLDPDPNRMLISPQNRLFAAEVIALGIKKNLITQKGLEELSSLLKESSTLKSGNTNDKAIGIINEELTINREKVIDSIHNSEVKNRIDQKVFGREHLLRKESENQIKQLKKKNFELDKTQDQMRSIADKELEAKKLEIEARIKDLVEVTIELSEKETQLRKSEQKLSIAEGNSMRFSRQHATDNFAKIQVIKIEINKIKARVEKYEELSHKHSFPVALSSAIIGMRRCIKTIERIAKKAQLEITLQDMEEIQRNYVQLIEATQRFNANIPAHGKPAATAKLQIVENANLQAIKILALEDIVPGFQKLIEEREELEKQARNSAIERKGLEKELGRLEQEEKAFQKLKLEFENVSKQKEEYYDDYMRSAKDITNIRKQLRISRDYEGAVSEKVTEIIEEAKNKETDLEKKAEAYKQKKKERKEAIKELEARIEKLSKSLTFEELQKKSEELTNSSSRSSNSSHHSDGESEAEASNPGLSASMLASSILDLDALSKISTSQLFSSMMLQGMANALDLLRKGATESQILSKGLLAVQRKEVIESIDDITKAFDETIESLGKSADVLQNEDFDNIKENLPKILADIKGSLEHFHGHIFKDLKEPENQTDKYGVFYTSTESYYENLIEDIDSIISKENLKNFQESISVLVDGLKRYRQECENLLKVAPNKEE